MCEYYRVYCDAYRRDVKKQDCEKCKMKDKYKVSNYKDCPFYGKFLVQYTGEIEWSIW